MDISKLVLNDEEIDDLSYELVEYVKKKIFAKNHTNIKTFDNLDDSLSFGESEHDKYHPKKGLLCCLHRKERKGFARENYKYLFVDPWVDEMVKDWVDVSKLLE